VKCVLHSEVDFKVWILLQAIVMAPSYANNRAAGHSKKVFGNVNNRTFNQSRQYCNNCSSFECRCDNRRDNRNYFVTENIISTPPASSPQFREYTPRAYNQQFPQNKPAAVNYDCCMNDCWCCPGWVWGVCIAALIVLAVCVSVYEVNHDKSNHFVAPCKYV
jgi:hypothetical protein